MSAAAMINSRASSNQGLMTCSQANAMKANNRIAATASSFSGWTSCRPGRPRSGAASQPQSPSQNTVPAANSAPLAVRSCVSSTRPAPAASSRTIQPARTGADSSPASPAPSQPPRTSTSTASNTVSGTVESPKIALSRRPARTSEVRMRDLSMFQRGFAETAEPARPLGEILQCTIEIGVIEVRPERVAEMQLGIGKVPRQEVRQAFFAAGPDEQVGGRLAGQRHVVGQPLFVDVLGLKFVAPDSFGQRAGRVGQVGLATVIGRDVQLEPLVVPGQMFRPRHAALHG